VSPLYKEAKSSVDYTDHAMVRSERCELCRHFQKPQGCAIVSGRIAPGGWCKRFERNA
jgi:hypothetical protein